MSNINIVTLAGCVGADPEQREFEDGTKVTKFPLAVNAWSKKQQKELVDWIDVETFSKLGDYIKKGTKIFVSGSLKTNVYQNKDGVNVKRVYVIAKVVELPNNNKSTGETTQAQPPAENTQPVETAEAETDEYDYEDEIPF